MLMMLGIAMPGYDIVNWHLQFHYIRTTSSYVCSSEAGVYRKDAAITYVL